MMNWRLLCVRFFCTVSTLCVNAESHTVFTHASGAIGSRAGSSAAVVVAAVAVADVAVVIAPSHTRTDTIRVFRQFIDAIREMR